MSIALSLVFSASCASASDEDTALVGRASVIDGDTIQIRSQRIRLHGMDAPESDQLCERNGREYRCGQNAALYLDDLLKNKTVRCVQKNTDRYGRIVAECFAGAVNVNAQMVRSGQAVAYREYSKDYVPLEDLARKSMAGIWGGNFTMPSAYRKGLKPEEVFASNGCHIKGNISSSGKRIYHLPGSSVYGRTRIDEKKGERWFCSVSEAVAAGWVPVSR